MKYSNLLKRIEKIAPPDSKIECITIWGSYEADCSIRKAHGEPIYTQDEYEEIKRTCVARWGDAD